MAPRVKNLFMFSTQRRRIWPLLVPLERAWRVSMIALDERSWLGSDPKIWSNQFPVSGFTAGFSFSSLPREFEGSGRDPSWGRCWSFLEYLVSQAQNIKENLVPRSQKCEKLMKNWGRSLRDQAVTPHGVGACLFSKICCPRRKISSKILCPGPKSSKNWGWSLRDQAVTPHGVVASLFSKICCPRHKLSS